MVPGVYRDPGFDSWAVVSFFYFFFTPFACISLMPVYIPPPVLVFSNYYYVLSPTIIISSLIAFTS